MKDLYNKRYYRKWWYGFSSPHRSDHKRILELVEFENKRVLDIGCGFGTLLRLVPTRSRYKYGIESNKYAVAMCRKFGLNVTLHADLGRLPYRAGFFDVVIMNEVIEHIKDPARAFLGVKKVLKRGGRLVVTTPCKNLLVQGLDPSHVSEMTYEELERVITSVGFTLLNHEVSGINVYDFVGRKVLFPLARYLVSVNVFHKYIQNAREKVDSGGMARFRRSLVWLGSQQLLVAALS